MDVLALALLLLQEIGIRTKMAKIAVMILAGEDPELREIFLKAKIGSGLDLGYE